MRSVLPIIILNYNGARDVVESINSFDRYRSPHLREIFIIIDNNSNTDDKLVLQQYIQNFPHGRISIRAKEDINTLIDTIDIHEIKFLYIEVGQNYGYSYSNNIGIKICDFFHFKYAIIANPDTRVIQENTTYKLYDVITKNPQIGVLFPKISDTYGNVQGVWPRPNFYSLFIYKIFFPFLFLPKLIYFKAKFMEFGKKENLRKIYTSIGCFFIFDVESLTGAGYLDENIFLYCEELVLAEKMKSVDKQVYYFSSVDVLHQHVLLAVDLDHKKNNQKSLVYFLRNYLGYNSRKIKLVILSDVVMDRIYSYPISIIKSLMMNVKSKRGR